jgi:hypothetical protein
MTAANQAIVTAFEDLGMSPEEISADQEYDIAAVKSVLMQSSSIYRKKCNKDEDDCNFTSNEEKRAIEVIAQLAQYSEDDNIRLRAAVFIRNDKRGRLDAVKQMAGLNINVISMNEQMKKALSAIQRSKQMQDIVEVKQLVETTANGD